MKKVEQFCLLALTGVLCLAFASCDLQGSGGLGEVIEPLEFKDPEVEVQSVDLVYYPSVEKIAAFLCPILYTGAMSSEVCYAAFGQPPLEDELVLRFSISLAITNPNSYPVPAVELLALLNLNYNSEQQNLGAVCVQFCSEDDSECSVEPDKEACSESDTDHKIETWQDVADVAQDFLSFYVSETVENGVPPELRIKTIPAGQTVVLTVTLQVSAEAVLDAVQNAISEHLDELLNASELSIEIPYSVEGTLWFDVEGYGKIGIGFGPYEDKWVIK